VYQPIAMGARHIGVYLRYHVFGIIYGTAGYIHAYTHTAVPMLVGQRYLYQRHIYGQYAGLKQVGNIAQKHGDEISIPIIYGLPNAIAYKHAVEVKMAGILGLIYLNIALHGNKGELYIAQAFFLLCQLVQQVQGRLGAAVNKQAVTAFNYFQGLLGRYILKIGEHKAIVY
jgi:hypothetical protein